MTGTPLPHTHTLALAIPPGIASPPQTHRPSRSTCARRPDPLPAALAPPLTQSVRSSETAAGAWERAARPAGVGPRRRVSPGTHGPWEPGTRKRREAEVGEGRRAHALASRREVLGSPFGRQSSYFQGRRKVPGPHPPSPLPAGLRQPPLPVRPVPHARLHQPRPVAGADPPREHARAPDPHALDAPGLPGSPQATSTNPNPGHTHTRLGREQARKERLRTGRRGRAPTPCYPSGQVHCGGGPPDAGTHQTAPGSWVQD